VLITVQATAEGFKSQLLSDAYWTPIQQIIQLLEPAIKLLRLADGDTPTTSKVHYYAHKVKSHCNLSAAAPLRPIRSAEWALLQLQQWTASTNLVLTSAANAALATHMV
jgi:hypothetical protein